MIYVPLAMPEHIARAPVDGLVLSRSPERISRYAQACVELTPLLRYYLTVVLQPVPQQFALTVSSARLTLSGRFRFERC